MGSCFRGEFMKRRDELERNTQWPRPLFGHKRMHVQVTIIIMINFIIIKYPAWLSTFLPDTYDQHIIDIFNMIYWA